jgi:gliding motility-associated-like protein
VFAAGTYPVVLQVSNGWGCTASLNGELVVLPLPVVTTSKDTVVCVGDAASLMGYGAIAYSWGPPGTLGCINCNPAPATPLVPSTYSVIGTDIKGCKDTAFVSVGHRTHTIAAAWGDTAICFGQEVAIFDTGGHTYVWTPPMGLSNNTIFNPMASPGSSTTYTVVAQLGTCIPDTDYVHVEVYSLPKVDAGPDQEVLAGTPVQLSATGFNTVTYVWTPSTGLSCFNCPNPEAIVSVTTTYVVTGTSQFGCKHSDSMTVYLFCNNSQVFVPNTFTPNADGENDVFYPRGVGVELVSAFRIYNRWGELLFERKNINLNDASNAWDGSYNDGEPRPDVYVYVIQATCTNGQPLLIKGDVTIVR